MDVLILIFSNKIAQVIVDPKKTWLTFFKTWVSSRLYIVIIIFFQMSEFDSSSDSSDWSTQEEEELSDEEWETESEEDMEDDKSDNGDEDGENSDSEAKSKPRYIS